MHNADRRLFLKSLGLLGIALSTSGCSSLLKQQRASQKMVVGGSGNTFYTINFWDKDFTQLDIDLKGHSFTQNPINPNEVIIVEKTRDSWCVVDIKRNIITRDYRKSDFIYYGHFAFSPDGQKLFVPKREKSSKQFFIDVLSTKNYEVIESIPFLELSGMHDVHYNSNTHELIIAAVGFLDSHGQKVNGVLVYDLMTKKINQRIQTNFSNALPTHLLNIGPNEYLVSLEVPGGQEEELGLSKSNNAYDYYTGVMHFKSDSSNEASLIVLNDQHKNGLKGNITNLAFNQNTQTIYLGNVESKCIFVLEKADFSNQNILYIQSSGLVVHENELFVSSRKKIKTNGIKNVYVNGKQLLTNTHFSIIQL